MSGWILGRDGFVTHFMVSGPQEEPYFNEAKDKNQLRYEALDRKLTDEELAQVLLHIAKHRGFRSTRKAETAAKENGAVLKATDENQKRMQEKGYRTVGEMI